ncbi:MAG: hypothetical protein HY908_35450 [Myxococcales bacterium]|nr:hypothetical protein [Myxococcales bacterium]
MPSAPVPLGQPQPAYGQPQPGAGYHAAQAPAMVAPQAARPAAAPAAAPVTDLPTLLMQASEEAAKGRKPQAFDKYREVLALDPANPEALGWVQDFLHQRRKFTELRDVLLAAARVPTVLPETRKDQLRQVAGICESKLRDFDTAILALKQITQIDRGDHEAREQLCNLLERQKRWDDLAPLLEQQAMSESDVETKIAIEKKVAQLHEKQRGDAVAAAEAWVRIAGLAAGDESAIHTAVRLFEQGGQLDAAANAIMENLTEVGDGDQKAALYDKLGELRGKLGDKGGAGDAYAQAAELTKKDKHYELSVRFYADAERFADAAQLGEQRASLFDGKRKAELLAEAAQFLRRADNASGALSCYEQASDLDPPNDGYAAEVEGLHLAAGQQGELVVFLLRRGEKLPDKAQRVTVRHRAAAYQRSLGDEDGARETMLLILKDGEDRGALEALLGWAEQRRDFEECVDFLKRLTALATTNEEKLGFAMREAQILADGLGDLEGAIARYEALLKTIDPRSRPALRAMSELEERRGNLAGAAGALERELELVEGPERATIAAKLAQLYEGPLDDARAAVRVLDIVHAADPEDFEAVSRLQRLCERLGEWPRVAHLLGLLIEVEGDEEEASNLTRQLASVVHERLGKGDEALAVLEKPADQGDVACQQAYVDLGLKLGWKGIVATKLVAWNESVAGSSRLDALRQAFMLFIEVGRDADALTVGLEVARSGGADYELAGQLETIALRLRDLEALAVAQDILVKGLVERARADEFVRQAEVMLQAGADPNDAIQHGEQGLSGIDPNEVDGHLRRLVALSDAPGHQIDVYERQVMRCKQPPDRIQALARAAQIAAEKGSAERARDFFNAALTGGATDEALNALEEAARTADQSAGGTGALLRTLAESLAAGGQGSRDGGRTRSALLRRAGHIALRDLGDLDRAFGWLGESIVAHVDDAALASLDDLGAQVGDMRRVEAALSRALEEVYDGPLVRKLLRKRATLRKDILRDYKGAAGDLKRLHDLAPADQDLIHELSEILTHLRDHRGMIELYEDQILRGRDPQQRAEVARKVARIWEEYLADAREAGDAWRRVLRMKPGDKEAQAGLDRAKAGKLKQAPPLPPLPSQPPPPVSVPVAGSRPPLGRATAQASSPPREETPAVATPAPEAGAPAPEPWGDPPHGEAQGYPVAPAAATYEGQGYPPPQAPAYEGQGYPAALPAYEGAPQAPAYEGQAGYPHAPQAPAYEGQAGYPHAPQAPAYEGAPQAPAWEGQAGYPHAPQAPAYEGQAGYPQPAYGAVEAYPQPPASPPQPGYAQPGYPQPGYAQPGYPATAYEGQPAPEGHGPADAPPAYPAAPPEGGQPGAYAPPGHAEPPAYAPPGYEQPAYPYPEGAGAAPGYAPPPLGSPPYPPMAPPPVAPQGAPPAAPGVPGAAMPGFPHLAPDAPEGLDLDDDDGVELIEEGPGAEPRQS